MSSRKPPFTLEEVFWSDIRREFTENLLKASGDFLVRKASKGDSVVVSVFWDGRIRHFQPFFDGRVYSFGGKAFSDIEPLIHFHFLSNVPLGTGETQALLKTPIKKKKITYKWADIQIEKKLGEGNFGEVFKVHIKSEGIEAAMKTLKGNVPKSVRETFEKELGLMETMNHPNVVRCLGIVEEEERHGELRILLELINRGSMDKLIRNSKLTARGKGRIIMDVAKGMRYLHSLNIIHRDLAARNILVNQNPDGTIVGKVSDFGLSRQDEAGRGYELKSAQKLPLKWLAPECFKFKRWTTASDVWSFGVLMWEVFTNGADPYSDCPEAMGGQNLSRFISNGGHPRRPQDCRQEWWDLMLKIFNPDDRRRVTMEEVVKEVERIYDLIKTEDGGSSRPK